MKKILSLLLLLMPTMLFAQEKGIDEKIDETFGAYTGWFVELIFYSIPFTEAIKVPWVLIVLVFGALYFTLYFKLINFRGFFTAINIVRGKYDEIESGEDDYLGASEGVHKVEGDVVDTIRIEKNDDHHGEVSHFQALTAALSATVGLGNIAGVAVAISIGGPGATFWMIVAGIIGMASKFAECTLGVRYREIAEDGTVYGGPMYYISKGLKEKGFLRIGQVLAIIFAVMCIGGSFGGGNMFQSNQAFAMLESYSQSEIDSTTNLQEVQGSKVFYSHFENESYTVDRVTEDSVFLNQLNVEEDNLVGLTIEDFGKDSIVLASDIQLKDSISEAWVGEEVVFFKPSIFKGVVKSVGDSVVIERGDELMIVAQNNFIGNSKTSPLSGNGWIFGLIMSILVGIVIIGGIKKIASVTDKIVPFMVVIYVVSALTILGINFSAIPSAFGQIFSGAFTGMGIAGGFFGVLVQGFRRAAFSNEAGIGSASIAHSAVKTKYAASEGLVALLEPFIDTVLVCTMTALVLVISNGNGDIMTYGQEVTQGVEVTSKAFSASISWFPLVLTIAVILFAFSTMISWSYYGYQAWSYLFGRSKKVEYLYKGLFCLFVIVGAASQLGSVIGFSDAMIFAMLVPNMIGLVILAPKVREELKKFLDKIKTVKK